MRVAVVGAGVSGLARSGGARVTVYEKEDYLGGHARTVAVEDADAGTVQLDLGFMVFNRMEDIFWEQLWRKRGCPRELYPDESSKDVTVSPELHVPNCDCGRPADVFQSRHPEFRTQRLVASTHAVVLMPMRGAFSFSGSMVQTSLTPDTSFSTIGEEGDIHESTSSGGFHLPLTPLQ
ncbi:uncharacterized protein [Miscanthus floridulus]|uniref:uncharacterized protein n=1 Tax=Miscanthus floridulus TaxID=154761 RepID=UPI0034598046